MKRLITTTGLVLALLGGVWMTPPPVSAADRHVGYYYPKPQAIEVYKARARVLEDSNRRRRIGFVVTLVTAMLERPFSPSFSIFAKGSEAEKLIIVSNVAGRLDTVYRVRALLATMTSVSRTTEIFREFAVEEIFTFLDLLKMMGFKLLTVSDGDAFAHQIKLE